MNTLFRNLYLPVFAMFISVTANADLLEKSEAHFERVTELKNQIEILELQKQIAELNGSANIVTRTATPKATPSARPVTKKAVVRSDIKAQLLYVVNNGSHKKYTFRINGSHISLLAGEQVNGWKLHVDGEKLSFKKGSRTTNVL